MDYRTIKEVKSLVRRFESRRLPLDAWDHKAHLTVCSWYVLKAPERAERLLRQGIKGFNLSHGIVCAPDAGYHETLTLFWLAKVRGLMESSSGQDLPVINAVVHGLGDKDLVLFHYSRERINSLRARVEWCDPDLRPLPKLQPTRRPMSLASMHATRQRI